MATPQIRITPAMIDALKKRLMGMPDTPPTIDRVGIRQYDNPSPQPAALSQPLIRMSDVSVTDSLPPAYNSQTGDLPNTDLRGMPPNVSLNSIRPRYVNAATSPTITNSAQMPPASIINAANEETRPRIAITPASTLANNYRNQPLETDTAINETQPAMQPIKPYSTVPSVFGGSAIPIDAPVISASRERTTQPINPLQRAAENAAAPVLPDFGQDGQGNQRTHAKRGFLGRAEAFAKDLGLNMLEGRGLIASAADATHAAINPDILAERRAKVKTGENQRELATQLGIAGEQAKIGQIRANTDLARAKPGELEAKARDAALKQQQQNIIRTLSRVPRYKRGENPAFDKAIDAAGLTIPDYEPKPGQKRLVFDEQGRANLMGQDGSLSRMEALDDPSKATIETVGADGRTYRTKPAPALSAAATVAGQAQRERLFNTLQANEDRRITERENRTDKRQQYGDNRRQWEEASKAVSGLDALYRQADRARARANDPNNTRAATDAQTAQDLESDIQAEEERIHRVYGDQFEEVEVPNDSLWGGETRKQLKLKAAPSMQSVPPTSQPTQTRGKTLQRMDSSSMDNQVKSHFDKGGKAIRVRDVKTGKETLVDNYSDYLMAIGRK